ncbi:hypothetical protein [Shewanella sp.]|uniref:hypothetical protein n=1 Tax=Shewanella sp. TaxID=50422 RepID=UPI001EC67725|nr:hypothetical protein [Shewanella sp.]NRB23137.1 hypothetical protein [Shewanella sp.]
MKTRNIQTVIDSDVVASVGIQGLADLQVRCLRAGDRFTRYIVVDSLEVKREPFSVQIFAEAQFNSQRQKFSFSAPELPSAVAERVKEAILSHIPILNKSNLLMA